VAKLWLTTAKPLSNGVSQAIQQLAPKAAFAVTFAGFAVGDCGTAIRRVGQMKAELAKLALRHDVDDACGCHNLFVPCNGPATDGADT
jgi:hypothetical protein